MTPEHLAERGSVPFRMWRRLFLRAARGLNDSSRWYSTYQMRPKAASDFGVKPEAALDIPSMGIAMQGPIFEPHDFSLETMRLYRQAMPDAVLVLATWTGTDEALLAPFRAIGVEIVLCDRPDDVGLWNINLQITSARAAVKKAAELGAEWIMKARTDQRIYSERFASYLVSLARQFPPVSGFDQRHRIIGVGHGSLKFAPYHVTDQTVFGHRDDMLRYWDIENRSSAPPAHWPTEVPRIYAEIPIGEQCRLGAAETYFASQFLESLGRPLEWTIRDTWKAYRDHFIFVDYASVDFFWGKVSGSNNRELALEYGTLNNRREMSFPEWFLLFTGTLPLEAADAYEDVLNTCFTQPVPNSGGTGGS